MIFCHASLGVCPGRRPFPCGERRSGMVLFRFSWQFRRFRPSPQPALSTHFGPLTYSEGQASFFRFITHSSRILTLPAQIRDLAQRPALPPHTESYSHRICVTPIALRLLYEFYSLRTRVSTVFPLPPAFSLALLFLPLPLSFSARLVTAYTKDDDLVL
ncbi:hypothetical protein PAXRUDRAFT_234851 [Paxillus rubicundulus Ve08.2h10]|uniref:Uncharacterized protein n=1 Tax=Paxillus rubicundulus Ve08.2h10 TaxID=930991 RepID=A0A0D0DGQ3_9AGAM|nr:hypothetical protein PAXRUDRAFT_234851 [Paxillus rubicundulus Ve08.2h10]